jgi:hypothetical protein
MISNKACTTCNEYFHIMEAENGIEPMLTELQSAA